MFNIFIGLHSENLFAKVNRYLATDQAMSKLLTAMGSKVELNGYLANGNLSFFCTSFHVKTETSWSPCAPPLKITIGNESFLALKSVY